MEQSKPPRTECLGPGYVPENQKPKATVSTELKHENVIVLPQTPQLIALLTMIRSEKTGRSDFIFYSNRIIRLLVEEGLNHLPVVPKTVTTPVGRTYDGVEFQGKILIQRDEETTKPKLYYAKLPEDIADRWVLLLDPMLATGGSALMAVDVLQKHGVPQERILFLNVIASPEGAANFAKKYPKLRVVTAFVDQGLDERKYIVPGLGDFGDRFYTM